MKSNQPLVRYGLCVSAAVACAAAIVVQAPDHGATRARAVPVPESFLDCTRITAERLLEPGLVIVCSVVAEAPIDRPKPSVALGTRQAMTARLANCRRRPTSRMTRTLWSRASTPAFVSTENSRVTCSR